MIIEIVVAGGSGADFRTQGVADWFQVSEKVWGLFGVCVHSINELLSHSLP